MYSSQTGNEYDNSGLTPSTVNCHLAEADGEQIVGFEKVLLSNLGSEPSFNARKCIAFWRLLEHNSPNK